MIQFIPKTKTINKDRLYYIDGNRFIKKDSVINRGNNEAKILSCLTECDNIPKIIEFFSDENFHTIVMEYVSGDTLENCINYLDFEDKFSILKELSKTIFYLIEKKIVHGDINESNIIYNKKIKKLYLIDFETAIFKSSFDDFGEFRGLNYIKNYLKI